MAIPTVCRAGRSLFGLIALTLVTFTLGSASARAEVTRKWTYDLGSTGAINVFHLRVDKAGGVAAVYDDYSDGTQKRRFLWLNERGRVLANIAVGPNAQMISANKDVCYLIPEFSEDGSTSGIRVIYRNGTTDLAIGYGYLDASSFGVGHLDDHNSLPFERDGFFAIEPVLPPDAPEGTEPRLYFVRYAVKKN